MRTSNLKEMGYALQAPDCFSADCFEIIQGEVEKQRKLKEKHGKVDG